MDIGSPGIQIVQRRKDRVRLVPKQRVQDGYMISFIEENVRLERLDERVVARPPRQVKVVPNQCDPLGPMQSRGVIIRHHLRR